MLQTTEIFGKITTSQFNKNVPDPLFILQRKREYIIIHRTFNFENPDQISALINVMFCILVSWWEYVILYKMEDINKL